MNNDDNNQQQILRLKTTYIFLKEPLWFVKKVLKRPSPPML